MSRVVFTAHLTRYLSCPPTEVLGATVGEVLEAALERQPRLRGYILDDQGRLRPHVRLFLDGVVVEHGRFDEPVKPDSELYVMQALSGGSA